MYDILHDIVFSKVQLTDVEWDAFKEKWHPISFNKGDYITRQGQVEKYGYVVCEGAQKAYRLIDGEEVVVAFSYKGSFSGVYDSFVTQQPSKYFLKATTDSQMLKISFDDFNELYDRFHRIERFGRLINEEALIAKANREVAVLSYTTEERIKRLWANSPQCFQLYSAKTLASYLGMKPETFSRVRKKLFS